MEVPDSPMAAATGERVDFSAMALPVLPANEQELAAHEELLKQLDKASSGKTLWRLAMQKPAAVVA